jgi:hypothetical protein
MIKIFILFGLIISFLFSKEFIVSDEKEFILALQNSENNGESDTIILNEGIYSVESPDKTFKYESSEGQDLIIKSADGLSRDSVILNGNRMDKTLSFKNEDHKITIVVSNISIVNGYSQKKGGGIYMESEGDLNLDNLIIFNNLSNYDGAGVYNKGTVVINDCNISNNITNKGRGGGVFSGKNVIVKGSYITKNFSYKHGGGIFSKKTTLIKETYVEDNQGSYGGGIFSPKKIKMKDSRIANNTARYDGGGLKAQEIKILDSNITENRASYGGGIHTQKIIANGLFTKGNIANYGGGILTKRATLKDSVISQNQSKYSGAGIKANKLNIKNSIISSNVSNKNGGGIETNRLIMANSRVINNVALKGGGINASSCTITNSAISYNKSRYAGGGIKTYKAKIRYSTICHNETETTGGGIDGVKVTITNSNISENKAKKGGGVFGPHISKVILTSSFLYKNSAKQGSAVSGNVKVYNCLLIDNNNEADGMTLHGKGVLVNNIIKNLLLENRESREIVLTGDTKIYNNFVNSGNVFSSKYHKLEKKENKDIDTLKNFTSDENNLTFHFGLDSGLSRIGLNPNKEKKCSELFNTELEYKNVMEKASRNTTSDEDGEIEFSIRDNRENPEDGTIIKNNENANLLVDISDLMIEGDQKIFSEIYFVIITRKGKYKIIDYFMDFGEKKGFKRLKGDTTSYRYHTPGLKNIRVKIIDEVGNQIVKDFSVNIYDLTREEFKEMIKDPKTRKYLEKVSNGVLDVTDDPKKSLYDVATEATFDETVHDSVFAFDDDLKLDSETKENRDEFNLTKMIKYNNSLHEVKEYILSHLEEFNLTTSDRYKAGVEDVKSYILKNPGEFNLTEFKNYEEIVVDIQESILNNLDEYNLTKKENVKMAFQKGQSDVLENLEAFDLMTMEDFQKRLQAEMEKLTRLIKANPSKYGIKITKEVLDNLKKGWTLLGTIDTVTDMSLFKDFKIIWIFVDGKFQGYSPIPRIRKQIANSGFKVFKEIPKNAGIWLNK